MFENGVLGGVFGPKRDEVTGMCVCGRECIMKLFMIRPADQISLGECEMGWACGTYGGEDRRIQGFGGETGGKENTLMT